MVDLPWAQNGFSTTISAIHNESRNVHRRSRPVISLLQCIKTVKFVQNVMPMSQVVQPLTTPVTFFSVEIYSAEEPRRCCLRGGGARFFDVSRPTRERRSPPLVRTHGIFRCRVPRSSQMCSRNITQSEVQFSQAVLPPTRGVYPSHVNFFLGSFAYSFITPRNVACALFHGLFPGSNSRVALTCTPFEWKRVTGEALLDVIQNLFAHHGSDPSLNQKKKRPSSWCRISLGHCLSIPSRKRPNYPA